MATAARPEGTPRKATPTLKLYDAVEALDILDELIAEFADRIEAAGGDIEAVPEIAELLAFAEDDFQKAVQRMGLKVRSLIADAAGAKVERDRLSALFNQKDNAAKRLKEYLGRHLESRGVKKLKFDNVTVRNQVNGQSSVSAEETAIEELYLQGSPFVVQKISYVLDRDLILAAHERDTQARTLDDKAARELPASIVVTRGYHTRVE